MGQQHNRHFTEEFKLNAIGLVRNGQSKASVCRDIDIAPGLLDKWIRKYAAFAAAVPGATLNAEHVRLLREMEDLRTEVDILRKALKYLGHPPEQSTE